MISLWLGNGSVVPDRPLPNQMRFLIEVISCCKVVRQAQVPLTCTDECSN